MGSAKLPPPPSFPLPAMPHHSHKPVPITAEHASPAVTNHLNQTFATPTNQNSPTLAHLVNEALNLHYCSNSDEDSPCPCHINDTALKIAQD